MPEDDPAEDPEGESDDSANTPETGPSEEGGEDELTPEELADEVLDDLDDEELDDPTDEPSDPSDDDPDEAGEPTEEDLSPEELADEVLQEEESSQGESEEPDPGSDPDDTASDPDEPSPEELAEEALQDLPDDPDEESPTDEDEPSPEELAEEVLQEDDPSEASESDEGAEEEGAGDASEEPTPEELADEVLEETEEEEDELSPEELAEAALDEEGEAEGEPSTEEVPDEPDEEVADQGEPEEEEDVEPTEDVEDPTPEEPAEDVTEEAPEEETAQESSEEVASEEESSSEPEPEPTDEETEPQDLERSSAGDEDEDDAEDEDSSIQSMLEQEAERAREEEEEEELPEGYLTVEQLPEEEEFQVPAWLITTGWYSLYGLIGLLSLWYLMLPLWETFLTNQIKTSMDRGEVRAAGEWVDWGTGLQAYLIKNDDAFRADYLSQLLEAEELDRFRQEYEALSGLSPSPFVDQVHAQYLLNQEEWSRALTESERLQRWVRTRGQGYLIHGRAALELGQYEQVKVDANRATQWIGEHPGTKRLLRDLHYRQGNYQEALKLANELQDMTEEALWSMEVEDFVRMARINKKLDRHRVAQRMLERALDRDPRNQEALKDLAKQYLLEERWERAQPLVEGSSERSGYRSLFPLSAFGWWAESELARHEAEAARSIRLIERAEDIEPRNAEVHRVKGRLYQYVLKEPSQAVREYEIARRYGIRRLRFFNELARARYQAGQFDGAVEVYSTLRSELGDTDPSLTYNLGSSYLGAGRYDRAEELISEAFNQGYRNQNSYNQWGLLLELRGERQQALAKYVEGIEWGERNGEPIGRVRENLNRALAKDSPTPLVEWLAPVQADLGIQPWRTLGDHGDTVPGGTSPNS